jgi:hypothetical protein
MGIGASFRVTGVVVASGWLMLLKVDHNNRWLVLSQDDSGGDWSNAQEQGKAGCKRFHATPRRRIESMDTN